MKKLLRFLASTAVVLLAAGCGSNAGSKADPPADFHVVAGDASAIVTWTAEPDVDYWIFFGAGTNITTENWATSGGRVITGAKSPLIVTGLANGVTYSFTINGRKDRGPGGSGAPTQVVTPMVAGANWAPAAPLGTARLNAIAGGPMAPGFVIATVGEGGALYTSVAAGPMTARTNPSAPADLNAVWYGTGGILFAAGANGTLLRSLDGTNWTALTSGTAQTLYAGASAVTATYVAVGAGGLILTSGDGNSWSSATSGSNDFYAVTNGNLRFVAVGAAGTTYFSTDGSNWGQGSTVTDKSLRGVAYGLVPSADGTTTTTTFVVVGDAGTVLTSTDGQSWLVQPPFTSANLRGITYGGRFVAVGDGGVIFTSPDGVAWTAAVSGTPNNLTSVARQLSGYTAVGDLGTNVSTF